MKINKSSGQASKLLIVLAVIVLVAGIITFLILRMAEKPNKPVGPDVPVVPQPVYEQTLGNIRFVFQSAIDRGNILRAANISNSQYTYYSGQKDLFATSGGRFIQVTIGAQNKGTINTEQNAWSIGNIIDSKDRNFIADDQYLVGPWLPDNNNCGALLKPAFDPAPCTKIYEVSKESTGLKIEVKTGKDNTANNLSSGRVESFLLDLIVK
jgi:hypothetical protein